MDGGIAAKGKPASISDLPSADSFGATLFGEPKKMALAVLLSGILRSINHSFLPSFSYRHSCTCYGPLDLLWYRRAGNTPPLRLNSSTGVSFAEHFGEWEQRS